MTEDQQLLQRYVRDAAPEALDELVRRYRDLVYSSALRQVRDAHLAEDVAQAVFIVLSKKASTIRQGVAMGGWLLAVTRRAALNAMKKQAIQHRHERAAAKTEVFETAEANWEQIDPILDSAMSRLSRVDRDAVVLRFFQQRSFAQVGAELGLSEEAARKRVERAIERMRGLLKRQGAHISAAALGTTIAAHSVHAAPATIVAASTSASATGLAKGVITMMTLTQLKTLAVAAAMFLLISGGTAMVVSAIVQESPAVGQIPPVPPTTAPFDPVVARDAILLRFQELQNLSISYHMDTTYPRGKPDASGKPLGAVMDGVYSRLGDRIRVEFSVQKPSTLIQSASTMVRFITTFNGQTTQSITDQIIKGQPSITGTISADDTVSPPAIEWILCLADFVMPRIAFADLALMEPQAGPNGRVLISMKGLGVGPNMQENTNQWELQPDLGYAASAYRYLTGPQQRLNIEVLADDFKPVNGLMLPFTIKQHIGSMRNGQWSDTQTTTITVKEYKLNDRENSQARYELTWPAGIKVTDARDQIDYIADASGKLVRSPDQPAK